MASPAPSAEIGKLAQGVRSGDRSVLSRAITLTESKRADHRRTAVALTQALLGLTGKAIRVGITGVPGVGKSTFIDAFGTMLTGRGHRVAVLAVDPSSARTGGSILGDKTRMARLSASDHAFIRPSPASGTLGGVIPAGDFEALHEAGAAAVFPPGTVIPDAAAELLRTLATALGHEL